MSSRALGCMVVMLPENKVSDFEAFFDDKHDFAFKNTEIELTETIDAGIVGFQKRIYDISCSLSLESCLIEPEDNDIRDVCYDLGLRYLDIDAINSEEHFSENIVFENGICRYSTNDLFEGQQTYDVNDKHDLEL